MESENKRIAKFEALLFQYGELVPVKKLARILRINEKELSEIADEYERQLHTDESRGLILIKKNNKIQLATKPELGDITQKIAKEEFKEELTPATLEVLTIVSYLGPISRLDIDYIRGVNSSFTIRNLILRGLVEKIKVKEGNLYLYQVTVGFLSHLGMGDVKELPNYENYKNLLEKYEVK